WVFNILQYFLDRCCPEACVTVWLESMLTKAMCGGQWREYMDILKSWVEAFTSASIRLVFFFDGVVEKQKRQEWVKRRCHMNEEVSKVFHHVKAYGEQPGRDHFCLPSALATFTWFALRSLGQEVFCSLQEADYEIASYARQKCCMAIGLAVNQLPLLACLLGNDVVSEEHMQHIRNSAMATYRCVIEQNSYLVYKQTSLICCFPRKTILHHTLSLKLSGPHRELLKKGICSYLLPGKEAFQQGDISGIPSACREKHVAAEGFMMYNVDEKDAELLPQALVYKPCRQNTYGLLPEDLPVIREWFVYPGNPLKEPELVYPFPLSLPNDHPSLEWLWFGNGPEVSVLRLTSFLSVIDCQEFSELYGTIEDFFLATLCLVTYIVLQTLSLEDVDAYLSQAVCLRLKPPHELQQIKVVISKHTQIHILYIM
uniref:Family with sequence similarity 120B n=1 Tax=Mastacembelus armatus TaxID=205130 RepID=A0A3Q3MQA3_9TELE